MIPAEEADAQRVLLLQECEQKITTGLRRGMEASRIIGEQLRIIDHEELWTVAGCLSMTDYIESRLTFDTRSARRMMLFSRIADLFESRQLALPACESQAMPLGKITDDNALVEVWQRVQVACERRGEPITVFAVAQAVEEQHEQNGVAIDLDSNSSGPVTTAGVLATPVEAAMARPRFTEKGEQALEKISRLCPPEIAVAIESNTVPITQDDLLTWADQDDHMIKTLAHYWADERWSIPKALRFEHRGINGATDINTLILLCRARNGHAVVTHDAGEATYRIIVDSADQT